jgi:hypothetical protein
MGQSSASVTFPACVEVVADTLKSFHLGGCLCPRHGVLQAALYVLREFLISYPCDTHGAHKHQHSSLRRVSLHQSSSRATKELRWFAIQRTLDEAVSVAARAKKPSGKRFSHQRRIPESVLCECEHRLLGILPALRQARSFEEVHSLVSMQIKAIKGIGQLTIYDTSLRIAAKLGLRAQSRLSSRRNKSGSKTTWDRRLPRDSKRRGIAHTNEASPSKRD